MRYPQAHAAKSGSVPFALRGPKSVRTVLAAVVAGAIGFVPGAITASPAQAAISGFDFELTPVQVNEGKDVVFQLVRSSSSSAMAAVTLDWSTGGQSDTADPTDDYTPTSGQVTFPADATAPYSEQTQAITIHTVDDKMDEDTEEFTLTVSDGSNTATAKGRIVDNDDPPTYTLVVDDAKPDESAGTISVYAKLNGASGKTVNIPIATADGTAKAGSDYTALNSSAHLTVAPGDTESAPQSISITDDGIFEGAAQTFTIKGSADDTVTSTATTTVSITDNEDQPELTIDQDTADEGDPLTFDVHLSGPAESPVTVDWASADGAGKDTDAATAADLGTAMAGSDYTAGNGTITFAGATTDATPAAKTVTVRTTEDQVNEDDEALHVTLTKPTIAKLGDSSVATGTITDDDLPPTVSLLPTNHSIAEGNTGRKSVTYTARLSKASGKKVTVNYSTSDGTGPNPANQGSDYISASGKLIFAPGETQKTFTVDIVGDSVLEESETFDVNLSSAGADASGVASTTFTITNDDRLPTLSVAPLTLKEGNEGTVAVLPVKLSNPLSVDSTYSVVAHAGTATKTGTDPGEIDYLDPAGTVTIPAGMTTGYVYFLVVGDDVYETDEKLNVEITPTTPVDSNSDPIIAGPKNADVTIQNDDTAPSLMIASTSGEEGDDVQLTGVTSGVSQHAVPLTITVKGASVNGSTAATTSDFTDPGPISSAIPAGVVSGTTIELGDPISLTDDTAAEGDETLAVSGAGFGGVGTVTPGVLTIVANDSGTAGTPGATAPTIMAPANVVGAVAVPITGKAAAGATVELWGAPMSAAKPALAKLLTTTAGKDGAFTFSRWIGQGYRFMVKVGTMTSAEKTVTVTQNPVFVATSTTKGVLNLAVQGNPRGGGQTVIVQRWVNGAWANAWRATTVGNDPWKGSAKLASGTALVLRAFVAGSTPDGIMPGYTESKRLTVK